MGRTTEGTLDVGLSNLQILPRVSNQSEDDPGKLGKREENTEPDINAEGVSHR